MTNTDDAILRLCREETRPACEGFRLPEIRRSNTLSNFGNRAAKQWKSSLIIVYGLNFRLWKVFRPRSHFNVSFSANVGQTRVYCCQIVYITHVWELGKPYSESISAKCKFRLVLRPNDPALWPNDQTLLVKDCRNLLFKKCFTVWPRQKTLPDKQK